VPQGALSIVSSWVVAVDQLSRSRQNGISRRLSAQTGNQDRRAGHGFPDIPTDGRPRRQVIRERKKSRRIAPCGEIIVDRFGRSGATVSLE
jgi:hypothetical protein